MIIKDPNSKDYVVLAPDSEFIGYYQFNPSAVTQIRITHIFWGKDKPYVQVSCLITGIWSSDCFYSFEVFQDNMAAIRKFLDNQQTKAVLETVDLKDL